jgi:hypothetical protein
LSKERDKHRQKVSKRQKIFGDGYFFPISTFVIIDEIAFALQKNDFVVKFGALSFFMIIS